MNDIAYAIYDYVVENYKKDLKRYIKEVAEDKRNFEYLVILTSKAGESPDFMIVCQGGSLMVSEKEDVYKTFNTNRYVVKYPVEINGIDKVINLREERKKNKKGKGDRKWEEKYFSLTFPANVGR